MRSEPERQQPPLHLIIELVRAAEVAKRHGVARGEWNRYLLRNPDDDGSYEEGEFAWDESMQADLSATADLASAGAAVERLAQVMRAFVDTAGWARIARRVQEARAQGRAVEFTVRSAAYELYGLPWELLDMGGQPLYQTVDCLLRYESPGPGAMARPEIPAESGRVLVAWAGAVPAAEHLEAIAAAARAGHVPFDASRDHLPQASLADLERELGASRPPVTILHLLCHGRALAGGQGYGLMLHGTDQPVSPEQMRALLAPHRDTLRLVVLAACLGSNPGAADNQLGSVAQAIHEAGVPAVIASRYPLTTTGSVKLTAVLYQSILVDLCSLENAFLSARVALQAREREPEDVQSLDGAALQLYGRASHGLDFRPWIIRPYRGLAAYGQEHERFFFGREEERQLLCRRMVETMERGEPRFLLVAGASGTGKSSLVRAGLLNDLEAGRLYEGSPRWKSRVMRPGEGRLPTETLARHVEELRRSPAEPGDRPCCALVVDQLEELFTRFEARELHETFLRALWQLACDPASGVYVIATLRIEYLGHFGSLRMDDTGALFDAELLGNNRHYLVGQLRAEQYERIIRGPARAAGLHLEPGLLESLLEPLRAEPGALPLLSYTLDQLWQKRAFATQEITWQSVADAGPRAVASDERVAVTGWWLTDAAYQELGRVQGALARSADRLLAGLGPAHRDEMRRLLVQLVHGHDDPTLATRRRGWRLTMRPDAQSEPGAARVYDEVLDTLIDARLLVQGSLEGAEGPDQSDAPEGGTWIELAHDSLIRFWPALHGWYREAQSWLTHTDELREMAEAWHRHRGNAQGSGSFDSEDPYLVLRGQRLRDHLETWQRHRHHLGVADRELIQAFLDACRGAERAHQQARSRRIRFTVLGSVGATLVMAVLIVWALGQQSETERLQREAERQQRETERQRNEARQERDENERQPAAANRAALMSGALDLLRNREYAWAAKLLAGMEKPEETGGWAQLAHAAVSLAPASTLRGHEAGVPSARFSPDGTYVGTASVDGTARIWRTDGHGQPAVLRGHEGALTSLSFSPDSKYVVTASEDRTARIWRVDGGGRHVVLQGHGEALTSAQFSPDGNHIVTTARDNTARIWRADGKGRPVILHGHVDDVWSAAFSPDGTSVVTASEDSTARIWRADGTGEPIVLRGHTYFVSSAAFSPDGRSVVTASGDTTARIWRVDGTGEPMILHGHANTIWVAAFSPDGRSVVTASLDHSARIWRVDGAGEPVVLRGHELPVVSAAFSPDGKHVVTASWDGTARIWRADGQGEPVILLGYQGNSEPRRLTPLADWSAEFSPDGNTVVTAYRDGVARMWRLDGQPVFLQGHQDEVTGIAFSADGKHVATASRDGVARVWPADREGEPVPLRGHEAAVSSAAFSPEGDYLVTASADKTARIWRASDGSRVMELRGHGQEVSSAMFSPDGKYVVTASADRTARIWHVDDRGDHVILQGHEDALTGARFSPDGKQVVTASVDGTARIWRADGEGQPVILRGHEGPVWSAAFSPDGKHVVTSSQDETVRIWRVDGEGQPVILRGHEASVWSAAFSPDSKYVVTASADETVRIWILNAEVQPLVLEGYEGPVRAAVFSRDGEYVVTGAVDEDTGRQVWLRKELSLQGLPSRLGTIANTDCLPPELREKYFRATADQARREYESCAREHGWTSPRTR